MHCGVCLPQAWVVSPKLKYAGSVDLIGAALNEFNSGYRHAGLIFFDRKTKTRRLLHLADHYKFKNEVPGATYRIFPNDNFSFGEAEFLAERAQRLWDVNGAKIAYGLDYQGEVVFDENMKFVDEDGLGLTCATFLLAFFDRCGFPIAEINSWLPRANDAIFQESIFNYLRPHLNKEQFERAKNAVGKAPRYRPEEVVACFSHYDDKPSSFQNAQVWGCAVLRESKMKIW